MLNYKKLFIILIILYIPFIPSEYLRQINGTMNNFYNLYKIIVSCLIVIIYIKKCRISKGVILISLFVLSIVISTIIKEGSYKILLFRYIPLVPLCMLTEMAIKQSAKILFKVLYFILSTMIVINFFLLVIFPNGLTDESIRMNFIEIDNQMFPYLLLCVIIGVLYSNFKYGKISFNVLILLAIISFTMVYLWSGTGIIGLFIVFLYLIFVYKKKIQKYINFKLSFTLYILTYLAVIIFRVQERFSFIIENLLHKSLTFSNRTLIWDNAINTIKESYIMGYGVYKENILMTLRLGYFQPSDSHNMVLEVLLIGGVIALTLIILLIIYTGKELMKYKENFISGWITIGIISLLAAMMSETYSLSNFLFILLTIGYNISSLVGEYNENIKSTITKSY